MFAALRGVSHYSCEGSEPKIFEKCIQNIGNFKLSFLFRVQTRGPQTIVSEGGPCAIAHWPVWYCAEMYDIKDLDVIAEEKFSKNLSHAFRHNERKRNGGEKM